MVSEPRRRCTTYDGEAPGPRFRTWLGNEHKACGNIWRFCRISGAPTFWLGSLGTSTATDWVPRPSSQPVPDPRARSRTRGQWKTSRGGCPSSLCTLNHRSFSEPLRDPHGQNRRGALDRMIDVRARRQCAIAPSQHREHERTSRPDIHCLDRPFKQVVHVVAFPIALPKRGLHTHEESFRLRLHR